jgi:hypothetical protein
MGEMASLPKSKLRRIIIILGGFTLLVAIFYAEENWRGQRAWENCKRQLEAKGETLDSNAYIPPPVPDDQNFFKASMMAEWFIRPDWRHSITNQITELLNNPDTAVTITNKTTALQYLAWSDEYGPDFNLIREALKRPYARMDGDYSSGLNIPIQNFVAVLTVARTLAQRTKCDLLLGHAEQALREVTLLHDMGHILEGKPMTLPAAMYNVDNITGLYVDTIADGMQLHAWQQPQLTVLQRQLAEIKLAPIVAGWLKEEPAAVCHWCEINQSSGLFGIKILGIPLFPRGWIYQNMANVALLYQKPLDDFNLAHDTVSPRMVEETSRDIEKFVAHKSPYRLLAAVSIPDFTRPFQIFAHNQSMANEAQIACALERYRLVHGEYPLTLNVLTPQFIDKLPHDIIGGQPLHYRRTSNGKFLLYSVGWNETDDEGQAAPMKDGRPDMELGDWVWEN